MKNCKFSTLGALSVIFLLGTMLAGCEKDSLPLDLPTLDSSEIFSLSSDAITIKSNFAVTNEDSITQIGICWSSQPNPTIDDNFNSSSLSDNIMYARIEGLVPNTTYYARVYLTNMERELYSNEIEFTTNNTVTDVEGNTYNVVTLGTQDWMVENLKTTKYNDGTAIPLVDSNTNWTDFDSPGYCFYANSVGNKNLYGALYNWPVVDSGALCPEGWHVPTDAEWTTLSDYLGGTLEAGGFMKSTSPDWISDDYSVTNYSGFSALPAGVSGTLLGSYTGEGLYTVWWSSSVDYSIDQQEGWIMMRSLSNVLNRNGFVARGGAINFLSVRCIKD